MAKKKTKKKKAPAPKAAKRKAAAKKVVAKKATKKNAASRAKPKAKRAPRGPHHVILGAGPAGINAIETIRALETSRSRITLVGNEPAYSRMVLPYYLADRIPRKQVFTGDARYFDDLGVECIFDRRAVFVDAKAGAVILQDGQRIEYDDLLVATGGSPHRPMFPGADLPGVDTLWTLDEADRLVKRLGPEARVVFIGAGFIGFIVLNALAKRGCKLDVVEIEQHVLPYMLDADAAELVENHLRAGHVGLHTRASVHAIHQEDGGQLTVELANGTRLPADAVVLATGVRPNINFLDGSGVKTRRGILVDGRLRTNVRNVYAAGDCAEGPDLLDAANKAVHAIQPTAVDHGRVAGANMAGKRVTYNGSLLLNILDVLGVQCASFGRWAANGLTVQTLSNPTRPSYRKLVWEDDRIVGAVLLGPSADVSNLNDMGMIKGIIQTQTPMGHWRDYLRDHPLDIRRAYIGAGVANTLLQTTLLGTDTVDRGYRFKNAKPSAKPSAHHKTFLRDFVPAQPTPAGPPR